MKASQLILGALLGWLVLALGALLTARLGFWPVSARPAPSALERAFFQMAFDASVARQATRLPNPISPTPDELRLGLRIFRNNCAGCHGDGFETSDWGDQFYPRVPQFGRHPPRKPDWQLFWVVKNGVRHTGMGGWDHQLPDERIWRAVTFLSRLDSLPRDVDSAWRTKPASNQ